MAYQPGYNLKNTIDELRNQYNEFLAGRFLVKEYYEKFLPSINKLLDDNKSYDFIGASKVKSLRFARINLSVQVSTYKEADSIGDALKAQKSETEIKRISDEILQELESVTSRSTAQSTDITPTDMLRNIPEGEFADDFKKIINQLKKVVQLYDAFFRLGYVSSLEFWRRDEGGLLRIAISLREYSNALQLSPEQENITKRMIDEIPGYVSSMVETGASNETKSLNDAKIRGLYTDFFDKVAKDTLKRYSTI
jgi:hypothetical protein